ncbi:hypothetical protein [Neisseria sp. Ec49-e6-T10]|uniref:hypothetical protein n=1 Tax=Neisseria sp. Ec49-e6-T10 TaxID=3140744 RepID=UPI003EBF36E9
MNKLYKINFGNLFTDAFVTDESNRLLFASIIGRNADIQSFIATIQLKKMENLTIREEDPDDPRCEIVGRWHDFRSQSEHLEKVITKVTTRDFGVLEHLFLFDKKLNHLDYGTKSTWMVGQSQDELDQYMWSNIKTLSDIPLLDSWQDTIVDMLNETITYPKNMVGNICLCHLRLPDTFDQDVSDRVKSGQLTV